MLRHFNTAGPCNPVDHYMLPPERRLPEARDLIEQKAYFAVHGPRRVGKTTALMDLAAALTREGRYASVLLSMEVGAPLEEDLGAAEEAILGAWRVAAGAVLPEELLPPPWPMGAPGLRLHGALRAWVRACPRPLVLFLDEVDSLPQRALRSTIRQLREGQRLRPGDFPWSLALVGLHDGRDHLRSITMRAFTEEDVVALYAQHTEATGQRFDPGAAAVTFEATRGQPWLVNALAYGVTWELLPDRSRTIRAPTIGLAKELLIERLDAARGSLDERLRDPRVRSVIEPMITGGPLPPLTPDDLRFVVDLGLVSEAKGGALDIANPIYEEIIVRSLMKSIRASFPRMIPTWLGEGDKMDLAKLLEAFIAFWFQYGEALLGSSPYEEAAPHLVLIAFLYRVVEGSGRVVRGFALGSRRLDLCVEYRGVLLGIEVTTWRDADGPGEPTSDLEPLDQCLSRTKATTGWLIRFDRRSERLPLSERLKAEILTSPHNHPITKIFL